MNDFKYTSLQPHQIRLLFLHPGAASEELLCSISIEDFDDLPVYQAISYVWGSSECPHRIKCGHSVSYARTNRKGVRKRHAFIPLSSDESVKATTNLKNMLLQLRTLDEFRVLWIDSLCINQGDVEEKTAQVRMMHYIYFLAESVLVYIGEADMDTASALKCARTLAAMKDAPVEDVPHRLDLSPVVPERSHYIPSHELDRLSPWIAFVYLFNRPWFSRIWVIQEIVMSKTAIVICGKYSISWDELYDACTVVLRTNIHRGDIRRDNCIVVRNINNFRQQYHRLTRQPFESDPERIQEACQQLTLPYLLVHTMHCGFTDPRDRVFALLNMTVGSNALQHLVDYSLSLREVYMNVAKIWVDSNPSNPLSLLQFVQRSENNDSDDIPSWLPDWRFQAVSEPLFLHGPHAATSATTVVCFPHASSFSSLPIPLVVRGVSVMTIRALEPVKNYGEEKIDHAAMINAFPEPYPTTTRSYLECYPKAVHPYTRDDIIASVERTCRFWDYVRGWEYQTSSLAYKESKMEDQRAPRYTQGELFNLLPLYYGTPRVAGDEWLSLGRLFFISHNGFMGLVPKASDVGDEICILFGAATPFVIRSLDAGIYKFIGECYVYGLMNGEVLNGLPEERIWDFVFE